MAKTVTLRLGDDVYEELREAAVAERRSLSNLVETAALARIREAHFVDDEEMGEILSDDALVHRLKTGSQQARRHKGRIAHDARVGADRCGRIPNSHVPELPDLEYPNCWNRFVKTTVDIPESELSDAIRFTGAKTKREAVVTAIAETNRRRRMAELAGYAGTCPDLLTVDELLGQRRSRMEAVDPD